MTCVPFLERGLKPRKFRSNFLEVPSILQGETRATESPPAVDCVAVSRRAVMKEKRKNILECFI